MSEIEHFEAKVDKFCKELSEHEKARHSFEEEVYFHSLSQEMDMKKKYGRAMAYRKECDYEALLPKMRGKKWIDRILTGTALVVAVVVLEGGLCLLAKVAEKVSHQNTPAKALQKDAVQNTRQ